MKKFIGNVAFIAVIIILLAKFISIFSSSPFPLSIVVSDSMEPVIYKGDIVPWMPCSIESIQKGDIVVYRSKAMWNGENYIVHRVVDIIEKNGKKMLITKGDANNYTDQSGPHIPEAPVDESMLQGKLIMYGKIPAKIPYLGYIWLFINSISRKMTSHILWQSPQSKEHFVIFTPFLASFSAFLLAAVLWLPNGKSLKEKLHELIFGVEKISAHRLLALILLIYIPFLLLTSFFAFDSVSVDKEQSVPVFNPSMVGVRAVAFFDGGAAHINKKIFDLSAGRGGVINISSVEGKEKLFIYSSPFWKIIPEESMFYFYNVNPKLCIIYSSIMSALILSLLTLAILIIFNLAVDTYIIAGAYSSFLLLLHSITHHFYGILSKPAEIISSIKKRMNYVMQWNDFMDRRAMYISLLSIPFLYFMFDGIANLFMVSLISSLILSIISYASGLRFKNEIAFISFSSSLIYSSAFVARNMFYVHYNFIVVFVQFAAITMLLSFLLFIFMFSMMFAFIFVVRNVMEYIDPSFLLEVGDI